MRRSDKKTSWLIFLIIYTALALIVPNVWLDITEPYISVIGKIINVFFPFAFYVLLISLFRKPGLGIICTIPFMAFGAFQIVLLYLYGESIIAVDMFLNVVTTDYEEATTLLGNLTPAIIAVCALYLPAIIPGAISIARSSVLYHYPRLVMICWSGGLTLIFGILLLFTSLFHYTTPHRDIFPINVINNICLAVERDRMARQYPASAEEFTYHTTDLSGERKIVAIVIGETSRPDRWQLFGAERETNPCLSQRRGLILFKKAITQSNTTHKSVPMLLTPLTASSFNELNSYKSIITAFNEAGYQTYWISNQPPNGAYNEHIGYEADTTLFYKYAPDVKLASVAEKLLSECDATKSQLLVFHTYGSHFPYSERYSGMEPVHTPDQPMIAAPDNRATLLNAYDNATIATDIAIDSIIGVISRHSDMAMLFYAADHGEDIFDDSRRKFLHASPAPTFHQLWVPMFIWLSPENESLSNYAHFAKQHSLIPLSPAQTLFHTVVDASGIETPYLNREHSLISEHYRPEKLMYLTDRNQTVTLGESGIRKIDRDAFSSIGVEIP